MEIYNKKENPDISPETNPDMHSEGVDILPGSGVREEGEFDGGKIVEIRNEVEPEVAPETTTPAPRATPAPNPAPTPNIKPATVSNPTPKTPEKTDSAEPKIPIKNDPSIKPIRTFKTDAEEAVKYQKISAVDIAVAEQKKRELTPIEYVEEKKSQSGMFLFASLILILVLGGGWFYWFKTSQPKQVQVTQTSVKTIIPYTKGATVVLRSDDNPLEIIGAKLNSSNVSLGEVYALAPTLNATSTEYVDVLSIFKETKIPSKLERSLAPNYMIGAYMYDSNNPFLILTNTFFQNTFAGMLEWEKEMRTDLFPIIHVSHSNETASVAEKSVFEDTVISNTDARVLKNSDGETILLYAFADTKTIIITTSEKTLSYLLDRLLAVRSVQ